MSKASTQKHRSNQSTSPTDVLHPKGRGGQRIGIEPRSGHGHGGGGGVGRHLRNRRNIDRVGVSVGVDRIGTAVVAGMTTEHKWR